MEYEERKAINERLSTRMYARYISSGYCAQTARLYLMGIGKYAFETSLSGTQPWELNINIPSFDTAKQAYNWLEKTGKWRVIA